MSILTDIHNKYKSHPSQFSGVILKENDFADDSEVAGGFGQFIRQGLFANAVGTLEGKPEIKLSKASQSESPLKLEDSDTKLTFQGEVNGLYFSVNTAVVIVVTEVDGHVHVEMTVSVVGNNVVPVEVLDWISLPDMAFELSMSWNGAAFESVESKRGNFLLADNTKLSMAFSRPGADQWLLEFEQSGDPIALADIGKILNLESELSTFLPDSFQDSALGNLAVMSMAVTIDTAGNTFQDFSLKIALDGQEWTLVPGLAVSNIQTDYLLERDDQGTLSLTAVFSGDISGHGFALTGVLNSSAPWSATLSNVSVTDLFGMFLNGMGVQVEDFFSDLSSEFAVGILVYFQEHIISGANPDGSDVIKPAKSFDLMLGDNAGVDMGGSLAIEQLGFLFTPQAGNESAVDIAFVGAIELAFKDEDGNESTNIVSLKTQIPTKKLDALKFEGLLEMSDGIPVGQFVAYLAEKGFGVSLPGSLEDFAIIKIGVGYSRTPQPGQTETTNPVLYDFTLNFMCGGTLPLDDNLSLDPTIDFFYKKEAGSAAIEVFGQLEMSLEDDDGNGNVTEQAIVLDLAFANNPDDKSFTGSLFIPEDRPVKLNALVGYFDADVVDLLPDFNLPVPGFFLAYTKDASTVPETQKGKLLLGVRPIAGMRFSDLPMVGNALPDDQEIGVSNLLILYAGADFVQGEITKINGLLPQELQVGDTENPSGDFKKGIQIAGKAALGPTELALFVPIAGSSSNGQSSTASATTTSAAAASNADAMTAISGDQPAKWFKVAKQLGPLYLSRVGFGFPDSHLTLFLEAELALGPLTLAMYGFSIGSPLDTFAPKAGLQGFGLRYLKPPVEISAMFLKIGDDAPTGAPAGVVVSDRFAGTAVIKTSKLSISAIGEYASTSEGPSFYLFAYIGYPLGGPAFFFVEGLALGFGFNRSVRLPHVSKIDKHPFVAIAMQENASLIELAESLISGNYVPISPGTIFLALGIRFSTFKILDSFALVVASFGNSFRLDLMGVSKLVLPPGSKEVGTPPLAEITLNLKASFVPAEGYFGLEAQLTRDSYILSKDCTLQGGFAFYSWFNPSQYEGDFVLSLGGYHPKYRKPGHYPSVPRLGFNWQVSSEVSIKGGMYFALTPTCVMAGGRLEAVWESGSLKAWFIIGADFLISWKPYFYDINLYLQFGVSYTFWFFGEQTLSVHLGADLHIWGPEFSGVASIDISVTSFEVEFGAGASLNLEALTWAEFKKSFLPEQVLGMTIVNGLIKETEDGSWIVDPDKLVFEIESAVPNKIFKIETVEKFNESPGIGAGPMLTSNLNTGLNVDLDELTVNPTDPTHDHFTVERLEKSIPAAVWGDLSSTKPAINPSKRLISNVLSGMRFTVIPPTPPDAVANISSEFLAFNEDDRDALNWEVISAFQTAADAAVTSVQNELLAAFEEINSMQSPVGQVSVADLDTLDLTVDDVSLGVY